MDSSCAGAWRYEQANPKHISQSLFFQALQMCGAAIKKTDDPPSAPERQI